MTAISPVWSRASRRATRSSRASTRGSASGRARWCRRCVTRACRWRSCRGRAARRSTRCWTRRRWAVASPRWSPPRTSGAASPTRRAIAWRWCGWRRRRGSAWPAWRSRTRPPDCRRRGGRDYAASASPRPVRPPSSPRPTRSSPRWLRSTSAASPIWRPHRAPSPPARRRSCSRPGRCACRPPSRARSPIRPATTTARTGSARCAPRSSATSRRCWASAIRRRIRPRCSRRRAPAPTRPACWRWPVSGRG